MMVKNVCISSSILESIQEIAESSKEMVKLMKKKMTALELMSQDLIMLRNLADIDKTAKQFYIIQKVQILKKIIKQNRSLSDLIILNPIKCVQAKGSKVLGCEGFKI